MIKRNFVKTFEATSMHSLEYFINKWLGENDVNVINISHSNRTCKKGCGVDTTYYSAVICYSKVSLLG